MGRAVARKQYTAEDIRAFFAANAANAVVESSAVDLMPEMDAEVMRVFGAQLATVAPRLLVKRIYGYRDYEDRTWVSLVLDMTGEPIGSEPWRLVLENAGRAMDMACELRPDLAERFSQIGIDH
jgi:hypothetical protein